MEPNRVGLGGMSRQRHNELGQVVGFPLPDWRHPPLPPHESVEGRWSMLEPLDPERHGAGIYRGLRLDPEGRNWTYSPAGPFSCKEDFVTWLQSIASSEIPMWFAVIDRSCREALGFASYFEADPPNGVIEIGGVHFTEPLKRTVAATESMYLMLRTAFDLGYRRCEWRCDALNGPSRAAAERLGFSFEGIFRQHWVYNERNRDTAYYSMIDNEWADTRPAFEEWLDPANFDENGIQRNRLRADDRDGRVELPKATT